MRTKETEKKICRFLKAKNSFGMLEGGENQWYSIEDANTQYWCVKTGSVVGPDDGLAGTSECIPGRKCFQSHSA